MTRWTLYGFVLQCLFASLLLAREGNAQKESIYQVQVNASFQQKKLSHVLNALERKTGFNFTYHNASIDLSSLVSIKPGQFTSLGDVLAEVSRQTGVKFSRVNRNIHLSKLERAEGAQTAAVSELEAVQVQVSGTVTDGDTGDPLPGVSILIKGSTSGTTTDMNGKYSINTDEEAVLIFSFIGYKNQEVPVGNRTVIDVALAADIEQLQEVVVVGYGTQQKRDITGSVASVKMETIRDAPMLNAVQALQGRTAGVSVVQNTGKPGAGFLVQVRGVGTLGNTQPLFVIDGIIGAGGANSINPNDIESIEVLKDASASAIYGSRAANGVVLITTKRGKAGKPTVSWNSYYGFQQAWKKLDVLNSRQYAEFANEMQANGGQPAIPALQNPSALQDVTNWQDELLRTAPMQDHNVTFSGGSEGARYLFSAGYYGQEGIVRNSGFDRFSFRANSDFSLGKRIEVGESFLIAATNTYGNDEQAERTLVNSILMPPYIPVYNPDNLGGFAGTNVADGTDPINPIKNTDLYERNSPVISVLGNAYLNYKIIEGLTYKFSVSVDYSNGRNYFFRPAYVAGERNVNPFAQLNESTFANNNILYENTLNYRKLIGKHSFGALVGYTRQWFDGRSFGVNVRNFPSNDIRVISAGTELQNYSGTASDWSLSSVPGRINYSYDDKYLFTANIRRDGSSRFADGNRYGVFPSFSLGWRVSKEGFMKSVSFIDDMKLRFGWGQLGNQEIGLYPWQATLTNTIRYVFGSAQTPAPAITQRMMANRDISWESTTQSNWGLDLSMFGNMIEVTAEYYLRRTGDMLLQVPISPSSGLDLSPTLNAGSVENEGIDLAINFNKSVGEVEFSVGGNASYLMRNEVTSLGGRLQPIFGPQSLQRSLLGAPIGHFFGHRVDRIYQNQAEIDADNAQARERGHNFYQAARTAPGDIRFKDLNGDGRVTADDREIIGNPIPKWNYGFHARVAYKNLDFSMMFQGMAGFEILNRNRMMQWEAMTRAFNTTTAVLDRWTPERPSTTMPRAVAGDPNGNARFSDRWMERGDFLRLKLVTVGYTVPASVLQSTFRGAVSSLRVYATSNNLLTFTNVSLWDPEFTNDNPNQFNNMYRGIGESVYPQARSFILGVQARF